MRLHHSLARAALALGLAAGEAPAAWAQTGPEPVQATPAANQTERLFLPALQQAPSQPGPSPSRTPTRTPTPTPTGGPSPTPAPGLSVNLQDRAAAISFFKHYLQSPPDPSRFWSGGDKAACNAGTLSAEYYAAFAQYLNANRAWAGIPGTVTLNTTFNAKAQQAALMMSVNDDLDHAPPTTWTCYTAAGAEAAGKSNLYGGFNVGPVNHLDAYIDDVGVASLGHRRWVLYPPMAEAGVGAVPGDQAGMAAGAMWVSGPTRNNGPLRDGFVAWPPPGYVPVAMRPRVDWSFSLSGANFSAATVTVNGPNGAEAVTVSKPANGYGLPTLAWRFGPSGSGPTLPGPSGDFRYTITISGVTVSGQTRTFTYDVVLIAGNV
jgi:uncharacterized protein YkwD